MLVLSLCSIAVLALAGLSAGTIVPLATYGRRGSLANRMMNLWGKKYASCARTYRQSLCAQMSS